MAITIHAATAVIIRDARVLICQRKADDSLGGYWEFPGGGLEPGETLVDCLHRELREELDVAVTIIRPLAPVIHQIAEGTLVLNPFLCDSIDREPTAIECDQFKWIDAERLRDFQFPPGNDRLIADVIAIANRPGGPRSEREITATSPSV